MSNPTAQAPEDEAVARLEQVCAARPEHADAWLALGMALAGRRRLPEARVALERALALQPDWNECATYLSSIQNELGDIRAAMQTLQPPGSGMPLSFGRRVRLALFLPRVYESGEFMLRWRQRYRAGLADLCQHADDYCPDADEIFTLHQTNLLLAYQGEDDLDLQRDYAGLLAGLIGRARPDLQAPVAGAGGSRIRVAFVSGCLRQHTVGHYFRSWVEDLDPACFEVAVVQIGEQRDAVTAALAARADTYVNVNHNALAIAERVRALQPDILIHPEIGMDAVGYLLANMRLAPVQCAAWGHPVTSGSTCIDYFFTSADMEPEDGDRHYSESLLRLPGLGTRYGRPDEAAPGMERSAFGLAADQRVYLCAQSLFKVHPDNDDVFLDIMAADPEGVVLFFQDSTVELTNAFAARLARRMAARGMPPRRQMRFLPRVTPAQFRAIVGLADVVLDTLHWSGGNSSLDTFSVGTPVVALPGRFMRGRQTQAMLRALGVPELIAADRQAYVATAVGLARDRATAADLHRRILAGQGDLYDRPEPTAALAGHLIAIHEAHRAAVA